MNVFISHCEKDAALARRLRDRLVDAGFDVFWAEDQIGPGDNWALLVGQALEAADVMIVLLTPNGAKSEQLRHEVQYAVATKRFKDRLLPVFVGEATVDSRDVPWILKRMPYVTVGSRTDFSEVLDHLAMHAE